MADKVRSRRRQLPWTNAFADAQTRKLTSEERSAVENYLESLTQVLQVPGPTGASAAPISGAECRKQQRHDADTRYHALWHLYRRSE